MRKRGQVRSYPNWNTDGSRGQVELRLRGQAREALEAYQLLAVKAFEEVEEFSEFLCGYAAMLEAKPVAPVPK